jgi:hypothetical protein
MQHGEVQHRLLLGAPMRRKFCLQVLVELFEIFFAVPRQQDVFGIETVHQCVAAAVVFRCRLLRFCRRRVGTNFFELHSPVPRSSDVCTGAYLIECQRVLWSFVKLAGTMCWLTTSAARTHSSPVAWSRYPTRA